MATALTNIAFDATVTFSQRNGNTLFPKTLNGTFDVSQAFGSGVGAKQCDRLSVMQFSIAASGTLSINLLAGTFSGGTYVGGGSNLVDLNGTAILFTRLKGLVLQLVDAASKSTQVHFNAAVTHAALTLAGKVKAAGTGSGGAGCFAWWDQSAAGEGPFVAATNDVLAIVNDDGTNAATVNLLLAGGAT